MCCQNDTVRIRQFERGTRGAIAFENRCRPPIVYFIRGLIAIAAVSDGNDPAEKNIKKTYRYGINRQHAGNSLRKREIVLRVF